MEEPGLTVLIFNAIIIGANVFELELGVQSHLKSRLYKMPVSLVGACAFAQVERKGKQTTRDFESFEKNLLSSRS
jgi:hypothetical protein